MIDVLCIGHSAYDLSFTLDHFPEEDQKYYITDGFYESGGGPSANAAYLLNRWRLSVGYGGLIGEDIFGDAVLKELNDVKIDTSLVQRLEGFDTPLSAILINGTSGSRTIINRRNSIVEAPLPEKSLWDKVEPQIILTDGHYHSIAMEAMERYPDAPIILDAGSYRPGSVAVAKRCDFLLASESFAKDAAGLDDLNSREDQQKALDVLFDMNGAYVAITRGDKGLIYKSPEGQGEMNAFPAKTVDTTGAGDIFHGAFAYALYWGMDWEESLSFSSLTAAYSVEHPGARASIPELHDVITAFEKMENN